MNHVTLRELAQHLGLGVSTVQRALTGAAHVKPQTRERVAKAAQEMGYKPDLYFSALAAHRKTRKSVGALVHYFFCSRDPDVRVSASILRLLREQSATFGLEVEPVNLREFQNDQSIPRRLYQRGSRGFIIGKCDEPLQRALCEFQEVPVICTHRQESLPFHSVGFSITGTIKLCWTKLWELGYRRIGCAVMSHEPVLMDDLERAGMAEVFLATLPPEQRVPVFRGTIWDLDRYLDWARSEKPEAIICFRHDLYHETVAHVGYDIPFVTLHADGTDVAGCLNSQTLLARECLRQMSSLIRHGEAGKPTQAFHLQIEPLWQYGIGLQAGSARDRGQSCAKGIANGIGSDGQGNN